MSEREEYTPTMDEIKMWYSGAVGEYRCDTGMSEEEGEAAFDRAIAVHDKALREQIADDPTDAEVEAALWAWISSAAEGVTRENVSPRVLDLNRPRARAALLAARDVAGR